MNSTRSTLVIDQGPFFPPAMRFLFAIVGIPLVLVGIGIPILAMSLYRVGTEIDVLQNQIREYGSMFGWRWGKWSSLEPYRSIVILRKRRVSTMYSRGQVALDQAEQNFDVTLVNATHLKKMVVKACDSKTEAEALAGDLSKELGISIVSYSPQRSRPRR